MSTRLHPRAYPFKAAARRVTLAIPVMPAFDNKVVILTGGALGIGRACALAFAREGAHVTIADVNSAAGEEAVRTIEAIRPGTIAHLVVADVSRASDCQRV